MYGVITHSAEKLTCAGIYSLSGEIKHPETVILKKYISEKYPGRVVIYMPKIPISCAGWDIGTIMVELDTKITVHRVIQKEISGWISSSIKRRNELICELSIMTFDPQVLTTYAHSVSADIAQEVLRAHEKMIHMNAIIAKLENVSTRQQSVVTYMTNSLEKNNEENIKLRREISELEEKLSDAYDIINTLDTRLNRLVKECTTIDRAKIVANINQPVAPTNVNTKVLVGDIHMGEMVILRSPHSTIDYESKKK